MINERSDEMEAKSINERFDQALTMLAALQSLPTDIQNLNASLRRLEYENELRYSLLKEQGWILKSHQIRLRSLEASETI